MSRLFSASRFVIFLAVIDSFLLATALLVYSSVETVRLVLDLTSGADLGKPVGKEVALTAIKTVDLLLIGTVLYIIGLGLYKLFIDERLPVSTWLDIHSIDDLKHSLVGVIIIILSVLFLEQVIAWKPPDNLLYLGVPIALVIAALAYFQSHASKKEKSQSE